MKKNRCVKCGHEWIPRTEKVTKSCPKCKRYDWKEEKMKEDK